MNILQLGEQQLGLPYVLGGNGVNSTDCSKFTLDTFNKAGIDLGSRDADEQKNLFANKGSYSNSLNDAQPGDLIFFHNTYGDYSPDTATHVGIYAGNGQMLHAGSSTGVAYTDLNDPYYQDHFLGVGKTGGVRVPQGYQQVPYKNPLTDQVIATILANNNPQNQPLVLDNNFYDKINNFPMVNTKATARDSYTQNVPMMLSMYQGSVGDDVRKNVMPILNQMISNNVNADVGDAELQNINTKQQQAVEMMKMMPQMKNPMEYQQLLGMIKLMSGEQISPETANSYWTSPRDANTILATVANNLSQNALQKYSTDLTDQRARQGLEQTANYQNSMLGLEGEKLKLALLQASGKNGMTVDDAVKVQTYNDTLRSGLQSATNKDQWLKDHYSEVLMGSRMNGVPYEKYADMLGY